MRTLRRAGLVHDFGRLGVSNSIWDKPGPLGAGEWERVRMHPYLTERMLHQSAALAPLGAIAVQHRERLDGSGYPRGLSGGAISRPARILGRRRRLPVDARAAPAPARARPAEDAAAELRAEVAGRPPRRRTRSTPCSRRPGTGSRAPGGRPAGLTAREVEVLRLLARGLSNKEIAERLVISPKTAGNHVEHIYAKIDASSRAAAAMFAVQHGLLPEEEMRQSPHAPAACPAVTVVAPITGGDSMPRVSQDSTPSVRDSGLAVDRSGQLGDYTVSFVSIRQGHALAPALRGLPGGSCPCPHWGYVVAGTITVRYGDREETYQAGDAFYMTPGHVPSAAAGTEFVQFSPTAQLAETTAAMMANAQAMQR